MSLKEEERKVLVILELEKSDKTLAEMEVQLQNKLWGLAANPHNLFAIGMRWELTEALLISSAYSMLNQVCFPWQKENSTPSYRN